MSIMVLGRCRHRRSKRDGDRLDFRVILQSVFAAFAPETIVDPVDRMLYDMSCLGRQRLRRFNGWISD